MSAAVSAAIDRCRLAEEGVEDVVDEQVILLLEARMRESGQHGELLVEIGQAREERGEIGKARDPIPLAALPDGDGSFAPRGVKRR